jgi:hypothetical protein
MYFSLPNKIKPYVYLKADRIVFPPVQNTVGPSILISCQVIFRFTALIELSVYSNDIFFPFIYIRENEDHDAFVSLMLMSSTSVLLSLICSLKSKIILMT